MVHFRVRAFVAMAAVSLSLFAASAQALDVSFSGNFADDDDVVLFEFVSSGSATPIALRTTSYVNGGFDPVLSLFDASGALIDFNDDSSASLDSFLQLNLDQGAYTLALTQADNYAAGPNLSDGFLYGVNPAFTSQYALPGGPTGPFLDGFGSKRTSAWTVQFEGVASASVVPEPGALAALAVGIVSLAGLKRRA